MGRKSREKRERRDAKKRRDFGANYGTEGPLAPVPTLDADAAQVLVEEGDGLLAGLSNGRPYALIRRDDMKKDHRGKPHWRRAWLRPKKG